VCFYSRKHFHRCPIFTKKANSRTAWVDEKNVPLWKANLLGKIRLGWECLPATVRHDSLLNYCTKSFITYVHDPVHVNYSSKLSKTSPINQTNLARDCLRFIHISDVGSIVAAENARHLGLAIIVWQDTCAARQLFNKILAWQDTSLSR
jgi:hypothetical protein